MTPKEKAKELVDKFEEYSDGCYATAKECAKIAVDEMLEIFYQMPNNISFHFTKYLKKVKEEINKL